MERHDGTPKIVEVEEQGYIQISVPPQIGRPPHSSSKD